MENKKTTRLTQAKIQKLTFSWQEPYKCFACHSTGNKKPWGGKIAKNCKQNQCDGVGELFWLHDAANTTC